MEYSNNADGLLTVKLGTLLAHNIKQYNQDVADRMRTVESDSAIITKALQKPAYQRHRTIRRRRKFVYHAADAIIEQGYWKREKRSLTKFHSNSLMYEYKRLG